VPAYRQDERYATRAPMIRRTVSLTEDKQPMITSLVVTVVGPDRPGIVSQLSAKAQGFGANWSGSRMAGLAGQFAGIVHFEVAPDKADALAAALRGLASPDLQVVIVKSEGAPAPAGRRVVRLELVGHDRPGIVRDLSGALAQRGVSIEELHTEIVSGAMSAEHLFKVKATLLVPKNVGNDDVRRALEALANEMMVDLALGDGAPGASPG
jgi:glycine cleavage system regulatory protein